MRVVVVGASGNLGTSLVEALVADPAVDTIVGVARRRPTWHADAVDWPALDIATDDLSGAFAGADVVVHLAWLIQPSRDEMALWRVNVVGTRRVLEAAATAGVGAVVYASSIGAYSPGPKDRGVDEDWPTGGVAGSVYSRHKASTERQLDAFEQRHPDVRVVRLRPGLMFKPSAATGVRRLFAGPFLPTALLRRVGVPVVPDVPRLVLQCLSTDDAAEAFRAAVTGDARGPFNLAADPVLDPPTMARALDARLLPVSPGLLRAGAALSWRARLQPTEPGWVDLALAAPLMATDRARQVLGWTPRERADDVLARFVAALGAGGDGPTPPLARATTGPARIGELRTGVGARSR